MTTQNPENLTITSLLRGDIQLASPPNIYFALKSVIDNPYKTPKDAGFVIEKDPALTAKLLKIVNSAYFGFPAQIATVEKAICLIGSRELENLVLGAVIIERFSDLPGQMFSMHDFWANSLRCALIARQFDYTLNTGFADISFVCGLLHNIGMLLFYRRIPVLARDVDLLLQSQQPINFLDRVLIEQQVIGFDHFQTGAELCRLWNLPEIIIETIRLHAFPDTDSINAKLSQIVRVADFFSSIEHPYDEKLAGSLNLSPEQLSQILDKVDNEFEVIFKLFYTG
jgi:HD-like signal output (HDOD) protein